MNFLIGLVALIGSVILRGLALKVLWGWFIVPLGVMAISIPHVLGVSIIVTFLTFKKPTEEITWKDSIITSIMISGWALLLGYIIQLFM